MLLIQNDKIENMPMCRSMLSALFETAAADIREYAALLGITEEALKKELEKRLLVDGMTTGIAIWAINFIPDVAKEHREKGIGITMERVLFDAIDMAGIYEVNCKPALHASGAYAQ